MILQKIITITCLTVPFAQSLPLMSRGIQGIQYQGLPIMQPSISPVGTIPQPFIPPIGKSSLNSPVQGLPIGKGIPPPPIMQPAILPIGKGIPPPPPPIMQPAILPIGKGIPLPIMQPISKTPTINPYFGKSLISPFGLEPSDAECEEEFPSLYSSKIPSMKQLTPLSVEDECDDLIFVPPSFLQRATVPEVVKIPVKMKSPINIYSSQPTFKNAISLDSSPNKSIGLRLGVESLIVTMSLIVLTL